MKALLRNWVVILTTLSLTISLSVSVQANSDTQPKQRLRKVSVDIATGNSGSEIPKIELSPGYGVNISFIKSGEIVEKVWLDNPGLASLDVDGCLSGLGQQCEREGATVIHLRRVNLLKMPQLPQTNTSLLTVIAKGNSGRRVYLFRIAMGDMTPKYHTIEVTPAQIEELERKNFPFSTNTTNLQLISQGLDNAQQQRLILPNSRLWKRIETFIINLKTGESINNAARKSGISLRLVNRLIELGNTGALRQRLINHSE
jgi:hypothetical protein